jgi:hypothetical protein
MSAFKKITVAALALGVLAPAFAFAQTATTTGTALVGQIQSLNAQIAALQQQRDQTVASLVNTIKQGSNGEQVAILQALLAADQSIYPEGIVSGFFGKLTAQAVKRFQKKHGLEQVGNVGPKTLRKLQEFLKEHPLAFMMASSTGSTGSSQIMSSTTATSTVWRRDEREHRRPCAIIPPGHLLAPGWLKKHRDEDRPIISECERRNLPPGIRRLLDDDDDRDDNDDDDDDNRRRGRGHGTTTPPVLDTTAPTISATSVSNIASTTATVSWTTNENATGKVYYGTTTPVSLGSALTVSNSALIVSHSFGLIGLATSTTYYYVLESKDAAANTATTSTQSFSTVN